MKTIKNQNFDGITITILEETLFVNCTFVSCKFFEPDSKLFLENCKIISTRIFNDYIRIKDSFCQFTTFCNTHSYLENCAIFDIPERWSYSKLVMKDCVITINKQSSQFLFPENCHLTNTDIFHFGFYTFLVDGHKIIHSKDGNIVFLNNKISTSFSPNYWQFTKDERAAINKLQQLIK